MELEILPKLFNIKDAEDFPVYSIESKDECNWNPYQFNTLITYFSIGSNKFNISDNTNGSVIWIQPLTQTCIDNTTIFLTIKV